MEQLLRKIGTRIRELRKAGGLTQEAFAEKANMESQYLSFIERGEKNFTIDYLERIASGFGIEPYKLLLFSAENSEQNQDDNLDKQIQDILKLCDEQTKKSLLTIIQTVWQLKKS